MHLGPLHHVGIVVPSFGVVAPFYRAAFGADCFSDPIETDDGMARIRFVKAPNTLIELIEPLSENSDLAAFLRANPSGAQHHLCYAVADIDAAWAWFADTGAEFVCPIVTGVLGYPIFFVRPKGSAGLLTEIIGIPA